MAKSQMWLGTCIELVNCGWIINSNRVLIQNLSVLIMAQLQQGTSIAPIIMVNHEDWQGGASIIVLMLTESVVVTGSYSVIQK